MRINHLRGLVLGMAAAAVAVIGLSCGGGSAGDGGGGTGGRSMVSHDPKEVAYMADRIVVLSANPGRIRTVIENRLPRPRDMRSPELLARGFGEWF